jgi:hypothetical protein
MSKSNDVLGGYQSMERRNLQKSGAEFASPEIAKSFPPPNNQLEASSLGSNGATTGEKASKPIGGDNKQLIAQAQPVSQRQQAPVRHYESSVSNTWQPDTRSSDGQLVYYNSPENAQRRATFIVAAGDWEETGVSSTTYQGKTIYFAIKKGRRTVSNFIRLVRKLEAAYPDASAEQITEMLRAIGGYNDHLWRVMMGKDDLVPNVNPVEGKLSKADIDALRAMMAHGEEDTAATERGVVRDNQGQLLAMGHVITGMAAGYNPVANADLRDAKGAQGNLAKLLGQGQTLNNLYASTIAGDLGQSAAIKDKSGADQYTNYLGDHTEATAAEQVGDVDGFNIGHWLQQGGGRGQKASEILTNYYDSSGKDSRNRWTSFKSRATDLADQTARFANNYRYTSKGGGITADVSDDATRVTNQFNGVVDSKIQDKKPTASLQGLTQQRMTIRTEGTDLAYLSTNASDYKGTKIATLGTGTRVCPLNPGDDQPFNRNLEHREIYGFTYCMVVTGGFEGQFGWISNSFLKPR